MIVRITTIILWLEYLLTPSPLPLQTAWDAHIVVRATELTTLEDLLSGRVRNKTLVMLLPIDAQIPKFIISVGHLQEIMGIVSLKPLDAIGRSEGCRLRRS